MHIKIWLGTEGTTPFYYSKGECEGDSIKKQIINKTENNLLNGSKKWSHCSAPSPFFKANKLCIEVEDLEMKNGMQNQSAALISQQIY